MTICVPFATHPRLHLSASLGPEPKVEVVRFYRKKYDAAKTLAIFNSSLREETDLDSLIDNVLGVVRETMQPEHVFLWLRPHEADAKEDVSR